MHLLGAEAVRHELETLERLLAQHGESGPAQMSRAALDGTDQKLRACLASNELWGGAGRGVSFRLVFVGIISSLLEQRAVANRTPYRRS